MSPTLDTRVSALLDSAILGIGALTVLADSTERDGRPKDAACLRAHAERLFADVAAVRLARGHDEMRNTLVRAHHSARAERFGAVV